MRIQSFIVMTLLLLAPLTAFSLNFSFLNNTASQEFDNQDWKLFDAAFHAAMTNTPDGKKKTWSNPATGNHGYLQPLSSTKKDNIPCRNLKIVSYAKTIQLPDNYTFMFCKKGGDWQVASGG